MLEGVYDRSKGTQIRTYNSLRRKVIPLYKSQAEETVFVVTSSGGNFNLYEVHGIHGKIMLLTHTLTMRESDVASLVEFRPVV